MCSLAYNIENKAQRVPNWRRLLIKKILYLVFVNYLSNDFWTKFVERNALNDYEERQKFEKNILSIIPDSNRYIDGSYDSYSYNVGIMIY